VQTFENSGGLEFHSALLTALAHYLGSVIRSRHSRSRSVDGLQAQPLSGGDHTSTGALVLQVWDQLS
jgi:hypothetical protein